MDEAAALDVFAGGFELRFDQKNKIRSGRDDAEDGRQDGGERDETHVADGKLRHGLEIGGLEEAGVVALEASHAGIVAQAPVELAFADIDRMDKGRAALKQAIGESPGGGPDVEAYPPGRVDGKGIECGLEFVSAAADVFFLGDEAEDVLVADRGAGFGCGLAVEEDLAGHHGAGGCGDGLEVARCHQRLVEASRAGVHF